MAFSLKNIFSRPSTEGPKTTTPFPKDENKEIVRCIEWVAGEYKYLEELKEHLTQVEKLNSIDDQVKEILKSIKVLHYIGKAEQRAYRFEKIVGVDLQKVITYLSKKISITSSGTESLHRLQKALELFKKITQEFSLSQNTLLTHAALYEGTLQEQLKKAKADVVFEQMLESDVIKKKYDPKEYEKIKSTTHTEFVSIIRRVQKSIGDAEQWAQGLETVLKQAQTAFAQLESQEKETALSEGYALLELYQFPIKEFPTEATFLAQHYLDLHELINHATNQVSINDQERILKKMFKYNLPLLIKFGNLKIYWPYLLRIASLQGPYTQETVETLALLQPILNEKTISYVPSFIEAQGRFHAKESLRTIVFYLTRRRIGEKISSLHSFDSQLDINPHLQNFYYAKQVQLFQQPLYWKSLVLIAKNTPHITTDVIGLVVSAYDLTDDPNLWAGIVRLIQKARLGSYALLTSVTLPLLEEVNEGKKQWSDVVSFCLTVAKYCEELPLLNNGFANQSLLASFIPYNTDRMQLQACYNYFYQQKTGKTYFKRAATGLSISGANQKREEKYHLLEQYLEGLYTLNADLLINMVRQQNTLEHPLLVGDVLKNPQLLGNRYIP